MIPVSKTKLLLSLVLLVSGTAAGAYYTGYLQKPDFGLEDRGDWGEIEGDRVEVTTSYYLDVSEKVRLNISRIDIKYRLNMNGVRLAEGSKPGIVLKKGNHTGTITSTLLGSSIPKWWATHIQNGETSQLEIPATVEVDLGIISPELSAKAYTDTIETDIESVLDSAAASLEGRYRGPQVVPGQLGSSTAPEVVVQSASAEWGSVTAQETNLIITTVLENPNNYAIPVPGFTGHLKMNEITVADWGSEDSNVISSERVIPAGETQETRFRVKIQNEKMKDWLLTHIERSEKTDAELNAKMIFRFSEGTMEVPRGDGMVCNFSFRTGILVDNQNSSSNFQGCDGPYTAGGESSSSDGSGDGLLGDGSSSGSDNSTDNDTDDSDGGLLF